MARGMVTRDEQLRGGEEWIVSDHRAPVAGRATGAALRLWTGAIGRASVLVERLVRTARGPRQRLGHVVVPRIGSASLR
jgi:hypothetical protein